MIAEKTGQQFNQRKNRNGAYWEDRYHATATETDAHLLQCLVYIDPNMVRPGIVKHPLEWPFSAYNEIQAPRKRHPLIDYEGLRDLLGFKGMDDPANACRVGVEESVTEGGPFRDAKWTESVAAGSEAFVAATKEKLGFKAKGREVIGVDGSYELRESPLPHGGIWGHENAVQWHSNEYLWEDTSCRSTRWFGPIQCPRTTQFARIATNKE